MHVNAWPSSRRAIARVVLLLLFANEAIGFWQPALSGGTLATIITAATVLTLVLAQFTPGVFRWITTLAAITLIVWWVPILAILTSGQFAR